MMEDRIRKNNIRLEGQSVNDIQTFNMLYNQLGVEKILVKNILLHATLQNSNLRNVKGNIRVDSLAKFCSSTVM